MRKLYIASSGIRNLPYEMAEDVGFPFLKTCIKLNENNFKLLVV